MSTPGILPASLPLAPLRRISPSRFLSLQKCPLREAWSQTHAPLLPPWPASRIGTVAHKLIELAGRGDIDSSQEEELEQTWNRLVEKMEQQMAQSWLERPLLPLSRSVRDYEVRRHRAFNRAHELSPAEAQHQAEVSSHRDKPNAGFERWVQTRDGKIGGKIDHVLYTKDGVVLRDYKTGYILEELSSDAEKQLKKSYQIQLKLYAALYQATYGSWPVALEVIPMEGSPQDVPFQPAECEALLSEARVLMENVNRLINRLNGDLSENQQLRQLASPAPGVCRYCRFRPACPAYRHARQQLLEENWPSDVAGQVNFVRKLGNGRLFVRLDATMPAGKQVQCRNITPDSSRHPAIERIDVGTQIAIYDLYQRSDTSFDETTSTIIYLKSRD